MHHDELNHIDVKQLPYSLQELIACIGLENAYLLTRAFGGRTKYIPKQINRTRLASVLPVAALEALVGQFAGLAIEIPKVDHFTRQLRNQQIQKESSLGLSRSQLADKYGLSLRQIGNIRRSDIHRP